MKITFSPKNSTDNVVIEGNVEELLTVIKNIILNDTPAIKQEPAPKQAKATNATSLENYDKFLSSIFTYRAQITGPGISRYVAEILGDGKPHKISELTKFISPRSVDGLLKTMRDNGAVVNNASGVIQVMSIPKKNFKPKKRTYKATPSKPSNTVVSALSGVSLS